MIYSLLAIGCDGKIVIVEIKNLLAIEFFKKEQGVFSEQLPVIGATAIAKIERAFGESRFWRCAHVYSIIARAGEKRRSDIYDFVGVLQNKYDCQYLVNKNYIPKEEKK